MRKAVVVSTVLGFLLGGATWATAQNEAEGRAFGTSVDLFGENLLTQSDTTTQRAPDAANSPNPATINKTAPGAAIPIDPIVEVITGPSTTRGCSTPSGCPTLFSTPGPTPLAMGLSNEVFVESDAGNATASVLIGQAPGGANLLDAVSSGASVTARCNNDALGTAAAQFAATSHLDALVIAGTPVPIPGEIAPNTTILAAQFPLLVLNEQRPEDCFQTADSAQCTVTALHAQVLPPAIPLGILELKLSSATAKITFDESCICNGPMLVSSKVPHVLNSQGGDEVPPIPNPGDTIKYVIRITNSGCLAASGISIIDRIPKGVTVDQTRLPSGATLGSCSVAVNGCFTGSQDLCLTIPVGDIAVNATVEKNFFVTVDSDAGCDDNGVGFTICNAYRVQGQGAPAGEPGPASVLCPNGEPTPSGTATPGGGGTPNPTRTPSRTATPNPGTGTPGIGGGGLLVTTGSGGCSIGSGGGEGPFAMVPVLLLGAWLIARRTRRQNGTF